MRQTFFSLARSPRPSVPYYWRDLLIGGRYRYLHRRAVLYSFVLHLLLLQVQKRFRAEVSYDAVGQFFHAANHHQHKLLERNEALVETYYLYCHTPIALAILYSTRMLVFNYYVPHISLHHRKHLLAHILH